LFRGLTDEQRTAIAGMMTTRFVVPGETIVHKGEVGTEMYFIGSGAARVCLPGRDVIVANGDFFGEMALLADKPVRMADVEALGFGRLLILSRRDFMRLCTLRPEIDAHIRTAAGERLKANSSEPGVAPSQ
jgi:CPA1 family monovalent cation:H+ antiporter